MTRMHWRDLQLLDQVLPTACIARGERKQLIMPRQFQYAWLDYLFPKQILHGKNGWKLWIETEEAGFQAGSDMFLAHVSSMLHHRGIVANLSLRENLLLPFLYHKDANAVMQIEQEVLEVAAFLDMEHCLDEQAGERSAYTHARISLGRCMLQKPDIIVAQDVHCGMPPHRLEHFRELFAQVMDSLEIGLLYLASSGNDGSGITFDKVIQSPSSI